jgi:hypothetical protein
MSNNPEFFKKNKYVVVRNALHKQAAEIAGNSLLVDEMLHSEESNVDQNQVVGATAFYSNAVMEAILIQMHRTIEQATGLNLCPTYAFSRIYRWGDELVPHKDRPSCEVSATLTLNKSHDPGWPIWIKTVEGEDKPIDLGVGDLMVYRGCEVEHWREKKLDQGVWMQVFIHYVDKDGPYFPDHAYDQRAYKQPLYEFIQKYLANDFNEKATVGKKPRGLDYI